MRRHGTPTAVSDVPPASLRRWVPTCVVSIMETKTKTQLLDEAQQIVDRAVRRGGLDGDERTKVKTLIALAVRRDTDEQVEALEAARGSGTAGRSFGSKVGEHLARFAATDGHRLDVKAFATAAVNGFEALGAKAPNLTGAPPAGWQPTSGGVVPLGQDRRYVYANMPAVDAGDATSVDDFRVVDVTVTGNRERAIAATTPKAVASPEIVHVNTPLRQHAVILDAVPNALLGSMQGLRDVLDGQGRHLVSQSLDAHVYGQLIAAAPAGDTGDNLIEQTRHGVAALRSAGHLPDLLIVSPTDAVDLDLSEDSGGYVFSVRSAGDASPLWNLRVVETPAAVGADPLLVASGSIGRLYVGALQVDADPFSGAGGENFSRNLTDLRFELSALMHIRDSSAAFRIGDAPVD
jgi:hypothetical protein